MNYTTVSIKEARNNLAELVERAALTKANFLITKFGKAKAFLIPADEAANTNKDSLAKVLAATVGIWAKRKDIKSNTEYAAFLRQKAGARE